MPGFSAAYSRTAHASPPPEGDPAAVAAAARTFHGAADAMDRSARDLAQALATLTNGPGSWQGEASLQFAELSNSLYAGTQQFANNFRELAGGLNSLASGLEYAQEKRREAEIGAAVSGLLLIGAIIQLGLDPADDAATAAAVAETTALTAEATAAAAEATSVAVAVLRTLATAMTAIRGLTAFVAATHLGAGLAAGGQTAMISWLAGGKIDWNEIGPSVLFGTVTGLPIGKAGGALLRALRREGLPEAEAQLLVRQEVQNLSKGEWRPVTEHMSDTSRSYQGVAGGRDGMAFVVSGSDGKLVRFDAYDPATNTLIEAKANYAGFLKKDGSWTAMGKGRVLPKLLRQARRQLDAAQGAPIEWRFMQKEAADAVRDAFEREGINIKVVVFPAVAP